MPSTLMEEKPASVRTRLFRSSSVQRLFPLSGCGFVRLASVVLDPTFDFLRRPLVPAL
jgi:hypothetical protein